MSQRSSRLASKEALSTSATEVSASEPVGIAARKARSKSKDALKVAAKKSLKSPARAKSKSPARAKSPSRAKKAAKSAASPETKPAVRGAKLYTKKDLVQEAAAAAPAEVEVAKKRTLRSSSSQSSMSNLKVTKATELEPTPEVAAPVTCCLRMKRFFSCFCPLRWPCDMCPVGFSAGYVQANKCMLLKIFLATLFLLAFLLFFNHFEAIAPAVGEQASVILNSVSEGFSSLLGQLQSLRTKIMA